MRLDCSYRFTSSDDMRTREDVETFFPVIIYDDDVMSSTGVNRMEKNVERGKARKGRCRCACILI